MNKIETCNKLWVCWCSDGRANGRWYTGKHEIRFSSADSLQAHVGLVKAMPMRAPKSWGMKSKDLQPALINLLVANTGCSKETAEVFYECYIRYWKEAPLPKKPGARGGVVGHE